MEFSIDNLSSFNAQAYGVGGSYLSSSLSSSTIDMSFCGSENLSSAYVADVKNGGDSLENVVENVLKDLGRQLSPGQQDDIRDVLLTAGRAAFPV